MQQAAAVGLEKFNNDPVLQFFKAYGVLMEGKDLSICQLVNSALLRWLHLDAYFYPSHIPMETVLYAVTRVPGSSTEGCVIHI